MLLAGVIDDEGTLLHPERVINMDETVALKGLALSQQTLVVGRKDQRVDFVGLEKFPRMTLAAAFTLDGRRLRPLVIVPTQAQQDQSFDPDDQDMLVIAKYVQHAYYTAATQTASITNVVFARYLRSLRQELGHNEWIVLYSDGHSTRQHLVCAMWHEALRSI
eukprot:m.339720 g.339720  ORF g.339720 m.339720 type:complete len:163 (+) comp16096_c0_seq15:1495-1983(+)